MTRDERSTEAIEQTLRAYFGAEDRGLKPPSELWKRLAPRLGEQREPGLSLRLPVVRLKLVAIIVAATLALIGAAVGAYALLYPIPEGFDVSVTATGEGGSGDAYLITSDELEQLTDSPGNDVQARWSPDCSRILFSSNRDENRHVYHLYVMNPDGTGVVKLLGRPNYADMNARWSPDGTRISFTRIEIIMEEVMGSFGETRIRARISDDSEVYLVNADGTGLTRLTSGPGGKAVSDWSPDGRRFLTGGNWDGTQEEETEDVYVVNVDGTGLRNLTNNAASLDGFGRWSPDGKRIVFVSNRAQLEQFGPVHPDYPYWPWGGLDIYVMDADGSNVTRLTDHPKNDIVPYWSPDGKWISFWSARISGRGGPGQSVVPGGWDTYVMKADGSDLQHVIQGKGHGWSSCKAQR